MSSSIESLLQQAPQLLPESDSARLDIEVLLCHCLAKPRSFLFAWPETQLTAVQQQRWQENVQRRQAGEPIAYITGQQEFWSLPFKVTSDTLIPRPATESLVATALRLGEQLARNKPALNVLDLGTGSGCIPLALAHEQRQWTFTAADASAAALAVAKDNATQLGIEQVRFVQSDWFTALPTQRFDLILSNPPYIATDDPHLQQGDVRFEPDSALVAANNGLADIQQIIQQASQWLADEAYLLLEVGYQQAEDVLKLMRAAGFAAPYVEQDLAGQARVCVGPYTAVKK